MIYKLRGKQVMLGREMFATKYHHYIYDKIITHYDEFARHKLEDIIVITALINVI